MDEREHPQDDGTATPWSWPAPPTPDQPPFPPPAAFPPGPPYGQSWNPPQAGWTPYAPAWPGAPVGATYGPAPRRRSRLPWLIGGGGCLTVVLVCVAAIMVITALGGATIVPIPPGLHHYAAYPVRATPIVTRVDDWTSMGGDALRSADNHGEHTITATNVGKLAAAWTWRGNILNEWTSPLIVSGVVYAPVVDGGLIALDAATGHQRWVMASTRSHNYLHPHHTPGPTDIAGMTYQNGLIYAVTADATMEAINAATGQRVWTYRVTARPRGVAADAVPAFPDNVVDGNRDVPMVLGQHVFYVDSSGSVRSLDARTGTSQWAYQLPASYVSVTDTLTGKMKTTAVPASGSVAASSSTIYVASSGRIIALSVATGRAEWTFDATGNQHVGLWLDNIGYMTPPVLGHGLIYVSLTAYAGPGSDAWEKKLHRRTFVVRSGNGQLAWASSHVFTILSPMVYDGQRLYAGHINYLAAFSATANMLPWNVPAPHSCTQSAFLHQTMADNLLFVEMFCDTPNVSHSIQAYDPRNGHLLWSSSVPHAILGLAIGEGSLFVYHGAGMTAYRVPVK